jgi:hypothetical protein
MERVLPRVIISLNAGTHWGVPLALSITARRPRIAANRDREARPAPTPGPCSASLHSLAPWQRRGWPRDGECIRADPALRRSTRHPWPSQENRRLSRRVLRVRWGPGAPVARGRVPPEPPPAQFATIGVVALLEDTYMPRGPRGEKRRADTACLGGETVSFMESDPRANGH